MEKLTKEEIADLKMLLQLKDIIINSTERAQKIISYEQSKALDELHKLNNNSKIKLPDGSVFNSVENQLRHETKILKDKNDSLANKVLSLLNNLDTKKEELANLGIVYKEEKKVSFELQRQIIHTVFNHIITSKNKDLARVYGEKLLEFSNNK